MSLERRLQSIRDAAAALGPWFHNIDLGGVMTAPEHFLGDYPAVKWRRFAHAIPADLSGRTVLDIGCNAGFYSIQMKMRGAARVLAIDFDPDYLRQARFAAQTIGVDIEFAEMSVYDVATLGERFDIVLFLGVLYHLRHPLLALDLIREHVVQDLFICQSMQRGDPAEEPLEEDYPFFETTIFERSYFPRMSFIEHCYAGDNTNWWIPNHACTAAMLRSSGFAIEANPEEEVFVCRPTEPPTAFGAVYPASARSTQHPPPHCGRGGTKPEGFGG
jgi:tRNA (mo5U34)-methyltransferase